ncbi:MAG: zf-HC2 domain-containing protein [Desulfobacteraceae bacterium]|jgi:hypothetical protein
MSRWMLNCKEFSQLVSEGLDRPLSMWDRASMAMHRLMCPPCNTIRKQIDMLRQTCRYIPSDSPDETDETCILPDDARMRIKKVLRQTPKS